MVFGMRESCRHGEFQTACPSLKVQTPPDTAAETLKATDRADAPAAEAFTGFMSRRSKRKSGGSLSGAEQEAVKKIPAAATAATNGDSTEKTGSTAAAGAGSVAQVGSKKESFPSGFFVSRHRHMHCGCIINASGSSDSCCASGKRTSSESLSAEGDRVIPNEGEAAASGGSDMRECQKGQVPLKVLLYKFLLMTVLFLFCFSAVMFFFFHLPDMPGRLRAELWEMVPRSWGESKRLTRLTTVKRIASIFIQYKQQHPVAVWLFLCSCYLLYQAFPLFTFPFAGSATVMTVLLGALFSPFPAFLTASVLAAVGPSAAYFMFKHIGKPIIVFLFPGKLRKLRLALHASGKPEVISSSNIPSNSRSSKSISNDNNSININSVSKDDYSFTSKSSSSDNTGSYCSSLCVGEGTWGSTNIRRELFLAASRAKAATAAAAAPAEQQHQQLRGKTSNFGRLIQMPLQKMKGGVTEARFDVDLFLTMLFLRVSPVFPNLFITAAAPLVEVPFDVFFYATLLGLMPNTILFVSMGNALSSLESLHGGWKLWGLLCVMGAAILALKMLRCRLKNRCTLENDDTVT